MRILCLTILLALWNVSGWADTLYLKSGQTIKGDILEKGSYYVVISVGGKPVKYNSDDIARMETEGEKKPLEPFNFDPAQFPNIPKKKLDLILQLIEINGTHGTMENNFQQIISRTPEAQREKVRALLNTKEIMARIIPLYDKYFADTELLQLIQFYLSPIGRKILDTMPRLLNESIYITSQYFEEKLKPQSQ